MKWPWLDFGRTAVALGARGAAPPENAGFLRADAALALVMITNEDDCSAPPDTSLFSQASQLVSDPLGPLQSYRCNEFGHLCNGLPPPRSGPLGSMVPLTGCMSAEDGRLNRVSEYAALFKGLKADPSQVFLSAITAPATPYAVTFITPTIDDPAGAWPAVEHSCTTAEGEYGDPAVRIAQLVSAFGDHGALYSICDEQYASVLTGIGAALARSMGLPCLPKSLEAPASTAPLLTGCTVSESVAVDGGARVETVVSQCGGGADPCWSVTSNAACADTGAQLSITRTTAAPVGAVLVARCP